jgi:hypothetical protein
MRTPAREVSYDIPSVDHRAVDLARLLRDANNTFLEIYRVADQLGSLSNGKFHVTFDSEAAYHTVQLLDRYVNGGGDGEQSQFSRGDGVDREVERRIRALREEIVTELTDKVLQAIRSRRY